MDILSHYKKYVIVLGGVLFVILSLIILSFSLFQGSSARPPVTTTSPTLPDTTPAPTEFDPYDEEYTKSVEQINKEELPEVKQDQKVALFLEKLPMQGTNFTAAYDMETNTVQVTIPTAKRTEGEAEFDAFLRANGVESRDWIQNLTFRYRDIDPDQH